MRFDYDPEVDALYIRLNESKIIGALRIAA